MDRFCAHTFTIARSSSLAGVPVASLKHLKNTVIGNPSAKLALARDGVPLFTCEFGVHVCVR